MDKTQISLIASIFVNLLALAKLIFDQVNQRASRRETAEATAFEQLTGLFNALKLQLEKKEIRDKEQETEIKRLETCLDELQEKIKTARLDLLDINALIRSVRRSLKALGIEDQGLLDATTELESQLARVSDCLKDKKQ